MSHWRKRFLGDVGHIAQGFEQRAVYERVLVLLVGLGLIWAALDAVWLGRLQKALQSERSSLTTVRSAVIEASQKKQTIDLLLQHDPDEVLRQRHDRLRADWKSQQVRWAEMGSALLAPEQAIQLLVTLLQKVPSLEKVDLNTLPAQSVDVLPSDGAQPAQASQGPARQPLLWRQSTQLTVRGSYRDVVQYIQWLERAPVRVHCQKLVLSTPADGVTPHRVTATLLISTLSFDSRWLAF